MKAMEGEGDMIWEMHQYQIKQFIDDIVEEKFPVKN